MRPGVHMRDLTVRTLAMAAAAAIAMLAGQARAAAQAPIRLTPDVAVERALKVSHRIGEAEARDDAAKAATEARGAARMPVVSAVGGYTRTNHVDEFAIQLPGQPARVIYPDIPDNWRARLDVQWPVYTSGRVQALQRAATAEQKAAAVDVSTTRADIKLDATRAYWNLVTAIETVKVVEEALKLVEAHLGDVRALRAAGIAAPNDVLSAEAVRSRQRVLLIEARNMRDVAEADIRRATGIGFETPIELVLPLDGAAMTPPAIDEVLVEARKNRTERQALLLRVDAMGEQRTAAAAGRKPVMSLGAGFDYARPNPRIFPRSGSWKDSWDVGFNVSWPIWDGGRVKADVAQVTATRRAARERLAEFDTTLEFEVRQRLLDVAASAASISASNDEVASAAEARRVVAERFKAGLTSNTEVLDAQQALVSAQLGRTRALAARHLAEARLDRALGR